MNSREHWKRKITKVGNDSERKERGGKVRHIDPSRSAPFSFDRAIRKLDREVWNGK